MKLFKTFCYRIPEENEIECRFLLVKAPNKTAALKMSRQLAKERDWRFLETIEIPEEEGD